jgi:hypothetical protein
MARRQRQNAGSAFADAFSSARTAVRDVRQGLKTDEIMEEEVIESAGEDGTKSWSYGGNTYDHAVKGRELRGLQLDRIEDMYLDMGDTDKLFGMVKTREDNRTTRLANNLTEETFDDNVKTPGYQNDLIVSQTGNNRIGGLQKLQEMQQNAKLYPLNVTSAELTNAGQELTNSGKKLGNEEKEVLLESTKIQQQIQQRNSQAILDTYNRIDSGDFDTPGQLRAFVKNNVDMTANPDMMSLFTAMGDSEIKSKLNEAENFSLDLDEHLRNDNHEAFLEYFDSVDGVIGNQEMVKDANGFRIVPIGENGAADLKNPIIQGKTWGEFKVNVKAWANPSNTLEFLTQKASLDNKKADTKRLNALAEKYKMEAVTPQSLAAYRKAKMDYLGDLVSWDEAVQGNKTKKMKEILNGFDTIYANGLGYESPASSGGLGMGGKGRPARTGRPPLTAYNKKGKKLVLNPDTNEWE